MKVVILVFPSQTSCLANFLFWSYFPNCLWSIRFQDPLKCNIPKKLMDQVDFFADNVIVSYKSLLFFLVDMPKTPKIISLKYLCNISRNNDKFVVLLQYLKKEGGRKFIVCKQTNNLSYKLIPLILVENVIYVHIS